MFKPIKIKNNVMCSVFTFKKSFYSTSKAIGEFYDMFCLFLFVAKLKTFDFLLNFRVIILQIMVHRCLFY